MSVGRIVAVLDLGTNAVKGTIARVNDGRIVEVLAERRTQTRMGQGVAESGAISPASMAETCAAACAMVAEARSMGASVIRVAGTSAVREAANAAELAEGIRNRCHLELETLSGDLEGHLSFEAVAGEADGASVAVFDLGGGSTEWILGTVGRIEWRQSFPIGAVRLSAALPGDPPAPDALEAVRAGVAADFAAVPGLAGRSLVGAGGTVRVMLSVAECAGALRKPGRLPAEEAHRQFRMYAGQTTEERVRVPGVEPDRADIILVGALVVSEAVRAAAAPCVIVSFRGWRHGLAASLG